ncbi:ABC transporter substrate-binding protein [Nocardiopsis composta]|uniref:ABC transporter substrate-binding protein n=1 Tax=Nocardiopsis composta TaxID=157465 RepID=UPI0036066D22
MTLPLRERTLDHAPDGTASAPGTDRRGGPRGRTADRLAAVEHGQGTADIPAEPERVITLSWTDTQIADALDAPVVAAVRNPDSADGEWPGTDLDDGVAVLDPVEPDLEAIASHRPDLILMTAAQLSFSQAYDRLSQIAPTVSYRRALLQDDGDELTGMIGAALGREAAARRLIASSEEAIEEFTREVGGLDGARVVFAQNHQGSTGVIVAGDSPVVVFFERLGLRVPTELARLAEGGAELGAVQLSEEELHLLDTADAVFVNTPDGEERFMDSPTVRGLDVSERGTVFPTGNELAGLLLTPNPATTGLLLDRLREPLTRVADRREAE